MGRRRQVLDPSRVVAYVRVSTDEQAVSGLGLEAQEAAIRRGAEARGWSVVATYPDVGVSGSVAPEARPGLTAALSAVRAGAGTLMVAKLDRVSRSILDFAGLMEASQREGWGLVALNLGVDTATPQGEVMANVMATFAQFERRLIGQRTRDGSHDRRSLRRCRRMIRDPAFYAWLAKWEADVNANVTPRGAAAPVREDIERTPRPGSEPGITPPQRPSELAQDPSRPA